MNRSKVIAKFDKISDESINSERILQYLAERIVNLEQIHCSRVLNDEDIVRLHTLLFEHHDKVKVESLKLSKNGLTTESVEPLARIIQQIESLRELDLADNELKPEGISYMLDHAFSLPTCQIETLHLSNNKLRDKMCCGHYRTLAVEPLVA